MATDQKHVDILLLGVGWTGGFLISELKSKSISYAATTTGGRDDTIPFRFDPESTDVEPYKQLPSASTVLIIFPLTGTGQSKRLTELYRQAHGDDNHWIQLGATFAFKNDGWNDESSPVNTSDPRVIAENELAECVGGCTLSLAALYGGSRPIKVFLTRVIKSKESLKGKGALHLIHGEDVARAIVAVHKKFTPGKRWILADTRVYDWWSLAADIAATDEYKNEVGEKLDVATWVGELMVEEGVRALPRDAGTLGRVLDTRGFWSAFGVWPSRGSAR